jgi:uncharacterized protein (TIGR04255 family)
MMADPDILYENAPLIEVIAEIRWELLELASMPGAAVDPHFGALVEDFRKEAAKVGFDAVERLIPEDVPVEIIPWRPVSRFRVGPAKWPLFQIGPGLFTANIVPPYEGWEVFREVIQTGLKCLYKAYPSPDRYLHIKLIELRYLDGFTQEHGYQNYRSFLDKHLGIRNEIRKEITDRYIDSEESIVFSSETRMNLIKPSGSVGFIKVSPGKKDNKDAIISELLVRKTEKPVPSDGKVIAQWFDEAHETLHDWFEIMISAELRERMGPSRPVRSE